MPQNATTLEGRIERITFRSPDSAFLIAKFRPAGQTALVTILGHLPPNIGETLRISGEWQAHARFGQQFKVHRFESLLPAGVEEIRRFLALGLIKGIGPKTADRLLARFQEDTLTVIEQSPERLTEVRGIGPETARRIGAAWREHHRVRTLMRFLQARDITPAHAMRVYKQYGDQALEVVQNDPERLVGDLPRIGFYIFDALARGADPPVADAQRARACIQHLLAEAREEGHMWLPRQALVTRCATAFELDYHAVVESLDELAAEERIVVCPEAPETPVCLPELNAAERTIARRLRAMLLEIPMTDAPVDHGRIMDTVVRRMAIRLSDAQQAALDGALGRRVVIVTGGPGTGKTTLIKAVAAVFETLGIACLLAAPTGRAARRLAEVTGRPAATVHKLLGFSPTEGGFQRDQDDPLDTEALVVDELSMVDAVLMGHLLDALHPTTRLVLVGDVCQLPSVGPGNVLADLIASGRVPTHALEEVFRQSAQSPIIANAHKVRHGALPDLPPTAPDGPLAPFTFIPADNPAAAARIIVDLCTRHIPRQLALDPVRQVQVLSPMHKGDAGTLRLNSLLQAGLNPRKPAEQPLAGRFCRGDKVMHLRNNYQKEVFNGEIGTIDALDREKGWLQVDFDGRRVTYDLSELDELALAYAISVHKSQGSEYPAIVLPIVTQHYVMLQRNLLYTALTRARQTVILVGSAKAVRVAVQADQPGRRRTMLGWWITQSM
ncbi:SF1B family DNA helicase RecD2 [Desulfatitalea alkaliphila]|uniref:ATP-dependent RecD-like DNA helicase n=1 Tax=Desulfatitalea alkaliphila TaxID=2929485 RepID=A0AA41UQ26_9BACT|nr:ATP-dependent RecD-like DNA helicase [Desulfatitalea alkaliphila]MCJ8500998.1 ATP-dependent RecD-like DNA helicase [Desulfatitalea alkaliphila]